MGCLTRAYMLWGLYFCGASFVIAVRNCVRNCRQFQLAPSLSACDTHRWTEVTMRTTVLVALLAALVRLTPRWLCAPKMLGHTAPPL